MRILLNLLLILIFSFPAFSQETEETKPDAITAAAFAMYGEPKYQEGFEHLDYVNPNAPKGGHLKKHWVGSFDNLNPYIVKGISAIGLGLTTDTLMTSTLDEPFSIYGLIAETMTMPEDRSWVSFKLRPEAKWHDGKQITAEDVKWTFDTMKEKGKPAFKAYYSNVESAEIIAPDEVKFIFNTINNRELPLVVGGMSVLPKHYWTQEGIDFSETTLTPPLSSGPYKISDINQGTSITYQRNPDWWAKDLPINKGQYNFDFITYQYYRDQNIALEALFAEEYNVREENTAKLWATAYDVAPVQTGKIKLEKIENEKPQGMQGFWFNTRRPVFEDKAVRKALSYAFDFEWSNKKFAYDAYTRSRSFFSNSEMEAKGLPSAEELAILEPYRDQLPESVFTEEYNPPKSDASGRNRENLAQAQQILEDAGYKLAADGIRVGPDGTRLEFQFIDNNPSFERWILPFVQNLKKIGVEASFRVVDSAQYQKRMTDFDFDMTVIGIPQGNNPGNEQRRYWSSSERDVPGSNNYAGISDPVVDELVEKLIMSKDREELVVTAKALDRVLQSGYYVIPNWHLPAWRVAYWDYIKRPETTPDLDLGIESVWWSAQP